MPLSASAASTSPPPTQTSEQSTATRSSSTPNATSSKPWHSQRRCRKSLSKGASIIMWISSWMKTLRRMDIWIIMASSSPFRIREMGFRAFIRRMRMGLGVGILLIVGLEWIGEDGITVGWLDNLELCYWEVAPSEECATPSNIVRCIFSPPAPTILKIMKVSFRIPFHTMRDYFHHN